MSGLISGRGAVLDETDDRGEDQSADAAAAYEAAAAAAAANGKVDPHARSFLQKISGYVTNKPRMKKIDKYTF